MSKLQDRNKFLDVHEMKDDLISKNLRMQIKNSETRMKAIKTINRAYQKIINTMMHDSLYFEPALNALQEDVREQKDFIDTTIRLGLPALKDLENMSKDYRVLRIGSIKQCYY